MFPLFLFTCTLILMILTILTTCLFFPLSLFLYSFVQLLCRYRNIYLLILIILILTCFFTSLLLYVVILTILSTFPLFLFTCTLILTIISMFLLLLYCFFNSFYLNTNNINNISFIFISNTNVTISVFSSFYV